MLADRSCMESAWSSHEREIIDQTCYNKLQKKKPAIAVDSRDAAQAVKIVHRDDHSCLV